MHPGGGPLAATQAIDKFLFDLGWGPRFGGFWFLLVKIVDPQNPFDYGFGQEGGYAKSVNNGFRSRWWTCKVGSPWFLTTRASVKNASCPTEPVLTPSDETNPLRSHRFLGLVGGGSQRLPGGPQRPREGPRRALGDLPGAFRAPGARTQKSKNPYFSWGPPKATFGAGGPARCEPPH